jgi:tetraacyldisaccharide 4'-kinase
MDPARNQKKSVLVYLLNLFSVLYKTISLINLKLKSLHRVSFDKAVILSINSLSFGGTGKSPAIIHIGGILQREGIRFAVITRGYKSRAESGSVEVKSGDSPASVGDEPVMLKDHFPSMDIYAGRQRVVSILKAIKRNNQVIILDDGFQSTHIRRDIQIMLYHPGHPYYYLRNFRRLLRNEDLLFSFGGPLPGPVGGRKEDGIYHFKTGDCFRPDGKPFHPGKNPLLAFSGLADNRRFIHSLSGFQVADSTTFPDHHPFSQSDLDVLNRRRQEKGLAYLLCTYKDFVKVRRLDLTGIPLLYVTNRIVFRPRLDSILMKMLNRFPHLHTGT